MTSNVVQSIISAWSATPAAEASGSMNCAHKHYDDPPNTEACVIAITVSRKPSGRVDVTNSTV